MFLYFLTSDKAYLNPSLPSLLQQHHFRAF